MNLSPARALRRPLAPDRVAPGGGPALFLSAGSSRSPEGIVRARFDGFQAPEGCIGHVEMVP